MFLFSCFMGIFSIIMGVLYVFNIYGVDSYDIIENFNIWGLVAISLGVIHLAISIISLISKKYLYNLKMIIILFNDIIQFIPISLWFLYNNITLGEYGTKFIGNWIYAVPHMIFVIFAILYIIFIFHSLNRVQRTI